MADESVELQRAILASLRMSGGGSERHPSQSTRGTCARAGIVCAIPRKEKALGRRTVVRAGRTREEPAASSRRSKGGAGKGSDTFEEIVGLDEAKRCLKEAVVLPVLAPELFVGVRHPWKGVLLFGPPGTGKTTLARAAARASRTEYRWVSSATLLSKWRGESEKQLAALFSGDSRFALFFDEIDALGSRRGGYSEHEASRRLLAQLLTCMDEATNVVVVAATNRPWDLDEALLRRLERRIYVAPPDPAARTGIVRAALASCDHRVADEDVDRVVESSEGFSAADVKLACRQAAMMPLRRLLQAEGKLEGLASRVPPLTAEDLGRAFNAARPTITAAMVRQHAEWAANFAEGVPR